MNSIDDEGNDFEATKQELVKKDWDFKKEEIEDNLQSIRLQVYLSHAGISSRRAAEEIIESGKVRVNGKIIKERGHRVLTSDEVRLDGKIIHLVQKKIYVALNKPEMFVCTNDDPENRSLAVDLIHSYHDLRLFSVGRLDFLSSGLIIYTNDGNFANTVAHPRSGIEKEYEIEARKEITDDFLNEFVKGIHAAGEKYQIKSYKKLAPRKVSLVLTEGKNREIRNACAARKVTIKSLKRVRIGTLKIGNLALGAYRLLSQSELEWFMSQSKKGSHGRRH